MELSMENYHGVAHGLGASKAWGKIAPWSLIDETSYDSPHR